MQDDHENSDYYKYHYNHNDTDHERSHNDTDHENSGVRTKFLCTEKSSKSL